MGKYKYSHSSTSIPIQVQVHADYMPRDYPSKYDAMVIRQTLHARHTLPSRGSRHPDARAFVAARAEQPNQLRTIRGEEPPPSSLRPQRHHNGGTPLCVHMRM